VSDIDFPGARWRKSRHSNGSGSCVEVGHAAARAVAVRDTKHPDGPRLAFGREAWEAFTAKVKSDIS
jgi:hypothetical protein